ncbi:MAG: M55 family metallopeptidase [Clostridiales bacterium]|jgi:D-amino peptidase|nr:M55 family metallopeptidase [Clostridiales bacterium]
MKLMVRTDMEGASGVVNYRQAEVGAPEYAEGLRYFLSDLSALLRGLGNNEIHIYDEHYYGRNIPLDALPAGVRLYYGKPPYRPDWAGGLDTSFDGLILLGFHAKAGTAGSLLPHSYELDIADIRVNGTSVGEVGLETMIAWELKVPLLLCVGDDGACAEARQLAPGVVCAETKKSFCGTGGLVYPLAETAAIIEAAAAKALTQAAAAPLMVKNPEVAIDLAAGVYRDAFVRRFPTWIKHGTVLLRQPTVCAAWAQYWQMKLDTQAFLEGGGNGISN